MLLAIIEWFEINVKRKKNLGQSLAQDNFSVCGWEGKPSQSSTPSFLFLRLDLEHMAKTWCSHCYKKMVWDAKLFLRHWLFWLLSPVLQKTWLKKKIPQVLVLFRSKKKWRELIYLSINQKHMFDFLFWIICIKNMDYLQYFVHIFFVFDEVRIHKI